MLPISPTASPIRPGRPGTASPLLIVGASARAAAESARRRGRTPLAIDRFGDHDLEQAVSDLVRVPPGEYPHALPGLARGLPPAPFMITGGLDAYPEVVRELERERRNEGSGAEAMTRARDPDVVATALGDAGLPCPALAMRVDRRRRWLVKPRRGGDGIRVAGSGDRASESHYLQEHIDRGLPCSAVYRAEGNRVDCLGVTRQLVGEPELGARPFRWCGNIGPLPLSPHAATVFRRIGEVLAAALDLRGFFGIDAVLTSEGPWTVEVNPRYTASVEIVEDIATRGVLRDCAGKAVVFAESPLEIRPEVLRVLRESHRLADIPRPGERIEAGDPILTVFARASTIDECRVELMRSARVIASALVSPARSAS